MGTNWFMPALVKRRLGLSGMRLEEGTMVCCFDLKKSRNDWRISLLVIVSKPARRGGGKRENTLGNDQMPHRNGKEMQVPKCQIPSGRGRVAQRGEAATNEQ